MKKNGNLPDMNTNLQQPNNLGNMFGGNSNQSPTMNSGMFNPLMSGFGGMGGMGGFGGMNGFGRLNNPNNFNYGNMFNPMMNLSNQNKQTGSSLNSTNSNNQNPLLQMFSNMSLNNNGLISD
jgi:hypothetical protein